MSKIKLGVIADDFTGASDAASFLAKAGQKTILVTKLGNQNFTCDCLVVALKIRSVTPKEAIKQCAHALDFLKRNGIEKIYYKYCSTFDSTPEGNIGIIMDYLMDRMGTRYSLLCPSLPINGRTVRNGILYVNGVPLAESSMKNHPLNPMWDSRIEVLMAPQSKYHCYPISYKDMLNCGFIESLSDTIRDEKFYLIPDYMNDQQGKLIGEKFKDLSLLSGGSGLLEHLFTGTDGAVEFTKAKINEKTMLVCGSCSCMSGKQINKFIKNGGLTIAIDTKKLLEGTISSKSIFEIIKVNSPKPTLVYSDAVFKNMKELRKSSTFDEEAVLLEECLSDLCVKANADNFERIIVAGGETSGAVAKALPYNSYYIGKDVAPGVPVLIPCSRDKMKVILKSGNFGDEDFFQKALNI